MHAKVSGPSHQPPVGSAPVLGLVTNIQKCSLHDGPGIRTTVFLKGCPLACAWCHNPENISLRPQVITIESRCVRCGQCLEACPQHPSSPTLLEASVRVAQPLQSPPDCLQCGACVEACPTGARTLLGCRLSAAEVLDEVRADRLFYEESGGGLTVSGGEPLVQFDFLRALLEGARTQGLHTALDTCGFGPPHQLLQLLPLVDLFLYDLKLIHEQRHREFTGVSNRRILDNLRLLASHQAELWLRIPIVPGVNDSPAELGALARFAAALGCVRQVNLLPYHPGGRAKLNRLHQPCPLPGATPPAPEFMTEAARHFAEHGLTAKIGG